MTELFIYQGKAALALVAFYIFYRLLLSKETFHRFNRIVLLGTAAMAFVLPLCVITINKTVTLPATSYVETVAEAVEGIAYETAAVYQEPIWPAILLVIFIIGALTVILMTVISIIKVVSIIRSGESQTLDSGEILVITENGTAPFSWMKYIVLSREDYESGYSQILTHEKAHVALKHSWDLLFVDLITVLQWFNPVIWMLKSDLRALHEFEADDAVLRSGADIKEYQYLLIKKAVSKSGYSVANSFNHSTLKQRITMMLNKKSSRMSAWKALYVLPLVGISLAATAETKVDYQYEGPQPEVVVDTPVDKDSKKSVEEKKPVPFQQLAQKPGFNGGDAYEFSKWVSQNLTYPEKSLQSGAQGRVTLQFTITETGKVADVKVLRGVNEELDNEAVRVVSQSPQWTPGKDANGEVVSVSYTFPVIFKLPAADAEHYQEVDVKPTFNGGDANEFAKWVSSEMKYPEECAKAGISGRVMVEFTIGTDGKVGNIKVLRGAHEKLDAEAVRVIGLSPDWIPGMKDGKNVPVKFTFPFVFKI